MKIIFKILISIFLTATTLVCQDKAEQQETHHGIFAGGTLQWTGLGKPFGSVAGTRLSWLLNHKFAAGAAIYNMFLSKRSANTADTITNEFPIMAYGSYGMDFEYFFNPEDDLNYSFRVFTGLAELKYKLGLAINETTNDIYNPDYGSTSFFVIEPGVNINYNINWFSRLALGVAYRMALGVDYRIFNEKITDKDINNLYIMVSFNLGRF